MFCGESDDLDYFFECTPFNASVTEPNSDSSLDDIDENGMDSDEIHMVQMLSAMEGMQLKLESLAKNNEAEMKEITEIEEKDKVRNWQPPISGELIMETFNLKPCKEIGTIKDAIREGILDGEIDNSYEAAYEFMLQKGKELKLEAKR